ncbi:MAG: hypothetical protein MUE94_01250 [Verrucomicrobia bacterium]|jgi:beta-phosphoglucomutase-like phosphatase (HAD superfamily)|nr:hypothetical protein [Verrucomicrobiota bacterium]
MADPRKETVCGLGNRKNELFNQVLEEDGVGTFESTVHLKHLLARGVKLGVANSSQNCLPILQRAGITHLFETPGDGVVSAALELKG